MSRTSRRRPNAAHLRRIVVLAALAGPFAASEALANGRFPRAERLIEDPSNPQHLVLAATYGLLTTNDRGKHWYQVCEAAFAGDNNYSGDPILELLSGGVQLVGVQAAIVRSPDGCTWTSTLGSVGTTNQNINDFAIDRSHPATVVAVVTRLVDGATRITLEESADAGLTWNPIGMPLPVSTVLTVDLDPNNAAHIYATGLVPGDGGSTGVLLQSLDHGATWAKSAIPNTGDYDAPYIAAIGPQDPNKIFVRTDSWIMPAGAPEEMANDALLYSSDGGAHWIELLRKTAKLLGFSLSPDGTTVLAGYGDPVDSAYYIDPSATGIYQASLNDLSFVSVFSGTVTCLAWTRAGTYVCTGEPMSGTYEELAFFGNGDLVPGGAAPTALMRLSDIKGPPPCCAMVNAACDWMSICPMFNACPDSAATSPACVDAGNAMDASGGDATPAVNARSSDSGCACRIWAAPTLVGSRHVFWGLGLVCFIVLRRGRAQRTRGGHASGRHGAGAVGDHRRKG